ncbi:DUF1015 domain-containing protein [Sporofaciens sp. JLR.KK001]|uniref:DUF1015 domain-containing protein n=1 Tax=Sporofaciens sp. JLR.KK001 TaxID=3112621 RepID=UPI002FF25799
MPVLRPFRGVRPAEEKAPAIAALPYDVYNREEAKRVVERNPLSFLKIDRAETQFPDETDLYSQEVYERAGQTLKEMICDGSFVRDEEPCFYLYALTFHGRTQTGIVGCAAVDDYLSGAVRKHENTKEDKEKDRIRHVDTLNAQTGPIFLAYRQQAGLKGIVDTVKCSDSIYDFISEDGIRHQVWKIGTDTEEDRARQRKIADIFSNMECVYIADGHHRAASAVKVGLKRRREYPDYDGTEEFNYFLSVLFPAEELRIFDYNRVVTGTAEQTLEELLERIRENFQITESASEIHPRHKGEIVMYSSRRWYRLTVHEELYKNDPVDDLDVSILQNYILDPLFDIKDPKTDPRVQFVGGIRGIGELVRLTDSATDGESKAAGDPALRVAFAMYPTSMDELLAVADSGRLMPPKSTWFEPKLRSGLFIHMM